MTANPAPDKDRREGQQTMSTPAILSPQEWDTAREQLLVKEKALTRARDALATERRRMPSRSTSGTRLWRFDADRVATGLGMNPPIPEKMPASQPKRQRSAIAIIFRFAIATGLSVFTRRRPFQPEDHP